LSATDLEGVTDLLLASATPEQKQFILDDPRKALHQANGPWTTSWDPRLSVSGNRVPKQLGVSTSPPANERQGGTAVPLCGRTLKILLDDDEFGFDRIERSRSPEASSLLYKIIDGRGPARSTALITNIPFDAWGEYLQDVPLATALLDRLVDRAVILQLEGKSYRAARARPSKKTN